MAERKTREELEKIKQEHNVFDIYSWSRYNLSETDMYSYFLKYIMKVPEDRNDSIYSYAGSLVHDLMEEFYNGSLKKEELEELYDEKMFEFELAGYKFNRNDDEQNERVSSKYNYCNRHYLRNLEPIVGENIKLEEYVLIQVGKFLFNGYSDFEYEKDGKKFIVDFKTSSIYKGDKVVKERGQLLLYALSKIQEGWKPEDITIGWLFTKYVSVDVPLKDSFRTRYIERNSIGDSLRASVKSALKKIMMYDDSFAEEVIIELVSTGEFLDSVPEYIIEMVGEPQYTAKEEMKKAYCNKVRKAILKHPKYNGEQIDLYLDEMCITNSIDGLPKEVQSRYKIYDCFVEIPFTQEDIDELVDKICNKIVDIAKLSAEYNREKDDSIFFSEIDKSNEFYHSVLSGYSPKLHKPYKKYLDAKDLNKSDEDIEDDINDILADLGIDI